MNREQIALDYFELRDGRIFRKDTGKPAQAFKDGEGYVRTYIRLDGKTHAFGEHRLVWFFTYGEWPKCQIDHINRDPADNRLENLRDVSQSENCLNRTYPKRLNRNAPQGWVTRSGNGWMAFIKPMAVRVYLGKFATPEEADAARKGASKLLEELRSASLTSAGEPGSAACSLPRAATDAPLTHPHARPSGVGGKDGRVGTLTTALE